jgi:hypothetical protein
METKTKLPAETLEIDGTLYRVRGYVEYEPPYCEYPGAGQTPALTWFEIDSIKVKDNSGAHDLAHSWVEIINTIQDGPGSLFAKIEDTWVSMQKKKDN